jgi:hypothetical protein
VEPGSVRDRRQHELRVLAIKTRQFIFETDRHWHLLIRAEGRRDHQQPLFSARVPADHVGDLENTMYTRPSSARWTQRRWGWPNQS